MASIEEDFPRGGPVKESKQLPQRTEVDNLFQSHEPTVAKKRKGAKQDVDKTVKKQKTASDTAQKLGVPTVDILHMTKNVKEGMLMLGCVKEVTDFEVVVSLPGSMTGYVNVNRVSDSYTKLLTKQLDSDDTEEVFSFPHLFRPGMLFRCVVESVVTAKSGMSSIRLSINPKMVNKALSSSFLKSGMMLSGCVESVEDHGFIIDLGISGTKGFLPKPAVKVESNNPEELKVGQYITCVLEDVKSEGRVVRLSVGSNTMSPACADPEHGWTLNNLLPGLMVNAQIKTVTKHGLILEFLSVFTGQVDFLHMEPSMTSSYTKGANVTACVLYVDATTRAVGLSLRSHLLKPAGVLELPATDRIGEVVHNCCVSAVHHMSGAFLELPDQTLVFAHKRNLKEPHQTSSMNKILAKPEHSCRIVDFNVLEQMYFVTLRKTVIESPFFRLQDVTAGQIVEATVFNLQSSGMTMRLTEKIKGFVPKTHLSDVILRNPEKMYVPGMKIKCRVLSVDLDRKNVILTRKKALLESTLPLLLTITDARRGRVVHGYIVSVEHFGCIVRFYNNVTGLLPAEELCSEGCANPKELYSIGQVVKVKVLRCDPVNQRMVLSIKAVGEEIPDIAPVPWFNFEMGKKVEARVLSKVPGGVAMSILPEGARGLLPTSHLSDHTSNCSLLWESLQEGDIISNLLLLSKIKETITLTKKPLLKWSLEEGIVAKDFSYITVGMQLVGWVKVIMPYGVFVEFPNGLSGLAPKAAISDKFLSDIPSAFQPGQTVFAKVTNLDEEKRRFLVSLKPSDTVPPEGDAQARLIRGLQERRAVADMLTSRGDSELLQQLFALSVGQKLKLTVDQSTEEHVRSFKSDELTGAIFLASKEHVMCKKLTEGQKVNAVVLYVDFVTTTVHVSLLPKLVGKKKTLEEGWTYNACYEFVDKDFTVISLGKTGHLTVIQTTSHLNETFCSEREKPAPRNTLTVTVSDSSCEELEGLPLVVWAGTEEKHKHAPAESKGNLKGFVYGQFVRGKVKSVKPTCVTVTLESGTMASVHVSEILEDVRLGTFPTAKLRSGSEVTARVIGVREVKSHRYLPISHTNLTYGVPELTLKPSKLDENFELSLLKSEDKLSNYQAGQTVTCFVSKFNKDKNSLVMTIGPSVTGTVELLNMIKDPSEAQKAHKLYQLGKALQATVVGLSPCKQYLNLSLNGVVKLEKDMVTMGIMLAVKQSGLVLKLPGCAVGTVSVVDLADNYKPNPLHIFSKNKVVRCFLLEKQSDQWLLSLRPSRLNSVSKVVTDTEILVIEDLREGQVIRGYLSSVEEDGVFVRLSRSIVGKAEFSQATKYLVPHHAVFAKNVPFNTLLTTKILSIDIEKSIVSLSLLHEDTGKPDPLPESLRLRRCLPGDKYKPSRKRPESESQKGQESVVAKVARKNKSKRTKTEDSDSGVEVCFPERSEPAKPVKREPAARLQVSAGFCWDAGLVDLKPAPAALAGDSSDGEDEEDTDAKVQKKSRHEKEVEKQQAEKALIKKEVELMDPGLRPQDVASFERLLLASPDSSLLWLQYMAFHLQATQIEQARSVAERAHKTICFREEQEKLNVWVALLNLENLYGTEESLKKVFERAQQFCEPMPVYQQLADIYAKSEKTQKAENLYKTMVKRFRQNRAVWLSYGTFLLMQGQGDAANALLQRALKSLHTKEHVDVIAKFAQLEFRYGDVEKGKSMLDKVLTSYPKRTDLWSVFIDLMVKHGSQQDVRALFDRVIHLSLAVKKIKFFFKRYLEYEKKSGTAESIQAVKEKALEYVEAKGTGAAC